MIYTLLNKQIYCQVYMLVLCWTILSGNDWGIRSSYMVARSGGSDLWFAQLVNDIHKNRQRVDWTALPIFIFLSRKFFFI